MPDWLAPFARGLGSSIGPGLAGAPVDAATDAVDLLRAGVGYAGHKMGLLDQPLELTDRAYKEMNRLRNRAAYAEKKAKGAK